MARNKSVFFKKKFEDPLILKGLNEMFQDKRGYAFKMPKRNEPVLLIVSGGLDSIMLWFHLMSVYGLVVYPIYFTSPPFNRNNIPGEIRAIKYFFNFYKKMFPHLVRNIKFMPIDLSFSLTRGGNIKILETNWRIVANNLKTNVDTGEKSVYLLDYPTRFARYLLSSYEYGLALQSRNIPVASIFLGVVPNDSAIGREPTLTVLRSLNMYLCLVLGDWKWQITGPVEKGFYFPKEKSITNGFKSGIPLEKTWSCARPFLFHCGFCNACRYRQRSFIDAGITDKTTYILHPKTKKWIKNLLLKFGLLRNRRIVLKKKDTQIPHIHKKVPRIISLVNPVDFFQNDEDLFVKNELTGETMKLNTVGGKIFRILKKNGAITLERLIEQIHKSYPETLKKKITSDIRKYLISLEQHSLVKFEF